MIELIYRTETLSFASLPEAIDHVAESYPASREWPSIIKKDGEIICKGNQIPPFIIMRYVKSGRPESPSR
jgi:hypothetical protein